MPTIMRAGATQTRRSDDGTCVIGLRRSPRGPAGARARAGLRAGSRARPRRHGDRVRARATLGSNAASPSSCCRPSSHFARDIRSRFLREAETAAQLNHPNIVPIYSVDERDGLVYFVMAFVQGGSLGDRLRDRGALPIDDARRILRELADALGYAHRSGVVHRDIKPDNILLDADTGRAMITDFGIARAATAGEGTRLTATGVAIGTPTYMSPEQCSGDRDIDGRSDLYSLGAMAYQMLTGEPPFARRQHAGGDDEARGGSAGAAEQSARGDSAGSRADRAQADGKGSGRSIRDRTRRRRGARRRSRGAAQVERPRRSSSTW